MPSIKHQLLELCTKFVEQRIATARGAIQTAQASANEETKSSSGDKYETGRAMAQLEIEKNTAQLLEAKKLGALVAAITPDRASATIQVGSLATTNQGKFFIAIPAGQLSVEGETYFVISPSSPLATCMIGLAAGQGFTFKARNYVVDRVE